MPKTEITYNQKVGQVVAMSFFFILVAAALKGLDEGFEYSD